MYVQVLKGHFEGADIAGLSLNDLLALLGELQSNDEDGAQVLTAWREERAAVAEDVRMNALVGRYDIEGLP